jgi:hypothetical protein
VAPEPREAFRQATAVDDDQAEVFEGIDHIRPQRERPPIGRFSLVQLALLKEDIAEIAVSWGIIGRNGHDPPEHRCGLVRLALTLEGDAESVIGAGVIGPDLQNSAVESFRLGQPPGSMVGNGLLQRGFELGGVRRDCHHRLRIPR